MKPSHSSRWDSCYCSWVCCHRLELLWFAVIVSDKAFHVLKFEPAVVPRPQAIATEQPLVSPLPHCVGMNMQKLSHLGGGHLLS